MAIVDSDGMFFVYGVSSESGIWTHDLVLGYCWRTESVVENGKFGIAMNTFVPAFGMGNYTIMF